MNMIARMDSAKFHLDTYFEKLKNKNDEPYYRGKFANSAALEDFFIDKLMNVKGFSSKAIGNVLLVFDKNYGV